jgi:hypothetical protein
MKALNRLGTAGALVLGLVGCNSRTQAYDLPKEADGRTFAVHIPEHYSFRQLEYRDASKDSLLITDEHAIPVDKYFRPGQFPRSRISIRLIGHFEGKFPTPANAKGDGRILKGPDGLEARAWIHTSTSPHELGLVHTYLIAGKKRMYQLNEWVPIDKRDAKKLQALLDQIILSMKIK